MLMMLGINVQWLFTFCYFGEHVTRRLEDVNGMFYQCDWFLFPIEVQKLMPVIIMNAKQPIYIGKIAGLYASLEVFGNVISKSRPYCCNRISFWLWFIPFQIVKAALSYFTMLRQFDWMFGFVFYSSYACQLRFLRILFSAQICTIRSAGAKALFSSHFVRTRSMFQS